MVNMFVNNYSWLNGLGVEFSRRVQTSCVEVEVMFNMCGIMSKEMNSSNVVEIIP